MKLSMIVPSIRSENLKSLNDSVRKSFSGDYELIVVSPYRKLPDLDCTWIESQSSPTVCQQLGLLEATGDYVCFGWDDGVYLPGAIDKMVKQLYVHSHGVDILIPDIAVSGKYIEGDIAPAYMTSEKYYVINNHQRAASPYITNDFMLFNTGLVSRETLLDIGGFDCRFETTGISAVDLAIRMQLFGVKVVLSEDVVLKCTWLPGDEGDHGPINQAFDDDFALLHKKYRQPIFHKRIVIPLDNWKQQPLKWERRFGT